MSSAAGASQVGAERVGAERVGVGRRAAWGPPVADAVAVLLFVLLGRGSHQEGSFVSGTLATAWPFLAGLAVAWLALSAGRRSSRGPDPRQLRGGGLVLLGTVGVGMVLRHLAGGATPAAFVLVATGFLALFLLGWRLVAARVGRVADRPVGRPAERR